MTTEQELIQLIRSAAPAACELVDTADLPTMVDRLLDFAHRAVSGDPPITPPSQTSMMIPCADCVYSVDRTALGLPVVFGYQVSAIRDWPFECNRRSPAVTNEGYSEFPVISAARATLGCGEGEAKTADRHVPEADPYDPNS